MTCRTRTDAGTSDLAVTAGDTAQQQDEQIQESAAEAVFDMERGLLNRSMRASARQAALFQDRQTGMPLGVNDCAECCHIIVCIMCFVGTWWICCCSPAALHWWCIVYSV